MIKISPSLLSADILDIGNEITKMENAGADMIHLDIMDGHFVPNITYGPMFIEKIRKKTELVLDVHLMISDPDAYIKSFADAGSDYITFHAEASTHIDRTIQYIKQNNVKAGIALNPATPVDVIKHVISQLDMVLIMSVNPGFGGQSFIPYCLDKIKQVRDMSQDPNLIIQVDGGISDKTYEKAVMAGANALVSGSYLFSGDMVNKIKLLKSLSK